MGGAAPVGRARSSRHAVAEHRDGSPMRLAARANRVTRARLFRNPPTDQLARVWRGRAMIEQHVIVTTKHGNMPTFAARPEGPGQFQGIIFSMLRSPRGSPAS